MEKVLTTIISCRDCTHSVLLVSADAGFAVLACNKTERVLRVVHKNESYEVDIPEDCPLPDFIEPKIK